MNKLKIATGDGGSVTFTKEGDGLDHVAVTEAGVLLVVGETLETVIAGYIPGAWLSFMVDGAITSADA